MIPGGITMVGRSPKKFNVNDSGFQGGEFQESLGTGQQRRNLPVMRWQRLGIWGPYLYSLITSCIDHSI